MSDNKNISLCVIAKNEERCIADCLNSVRGLVDEIVVVDTGSTDKTISIVTQLGARVERFEWNNDFSAARNFALQKCQGRWVIMLDADEKLEKEDKDKLKSLISQGNCDGAHFRVLNYVGASEKNRQYTVHNALRLLKNDGTYKFCGSIHEQIARTDGKPVTPGAFVVSDIRLHHTGYLDEVISSKAKRERNLPLLIEQHHNNPQDCFVMFNIGNEYMASADYREADKWYLRAQTNAPKEQAFTPHLYHRRTLTLIALGDWTEAAKVADHGLEIYPQCTDLMVLKGKIFKDRGFYLQASECFEKALKMGDAPPALKFTDGCASVIPLTELAYLYEREGDYTRAIDYHTQAIQAQPTNYSSLYRIGDNLRRSKVAGEEAAERLKKFFVDYTHAPHALMLADILLTYGYYDQAINITKDMKDGGYKHERAYIMGRINLLGGDYSDAVENLNSMLEGVGQPNLFAAYDLAAVVTAIVIAMLINHRDINAKVIQATEKAYGKECAKAARQFLTLAKGTKYNRLKGIKAAKIMPYIEKVLGELLRAAAYDLFEKALYIYNYIDSKDVLLSLAEVYMEYNLPAFAVANIIRSVKELGRINLKSAHLLSEAWSLEPTWIAEKSLN